MKTVKILHDNFEEKIDPENAAEYVKKRPKIESQVIYHCLQILDNEKNINVIFSIAVSKN